MALYDSADLLDRFKHLASLATNVQGLDDPDIYRYLTDAQLYWIGQFQNMFPALNWATMEKMTAASDNKSYSFSQTPIGQVEIYESKRAREPMRAGAPWDHTADFYWQGETTIVIPGDRPRAFADGPYARYVPRPDDIAADSEPVLIPKEARLLILYSALIQWAYGEKLEDPARYEDMLDGFWTGKRPGDGGLMATLKARFGSNSIGDPGPWYKSPDLSNVPVRTS